VYDALRSTRPYKLSFSHLKAYDLITEDSGRHFDPDLIDVFKALHLEMARIFNENQIDVTTKNTVTSRLSLCSLLSPLFLAANVKIACTKYCRTAYIIAKC